MPCYLCQHTTHLMHCYWEPSPSPRAVSSYRDGHELCCQLLLASLGMQMEEDNSSLPLPPRRSCTAGSYCQHGHYTWGSVPERVSEIAPAQLHLGLKWIENQLYHKQDVQLAFTKSFFLISFFPHYWNKEERQFPSVPTGSEDRNRSSFSLSCHDLSSPLSARLPKTSSIIYHGCRL